MQAVAKAARVGNPNHGHSQAHQDKTMQDPKMSEAHHDSSLCSTGAQKTNMKNCESFKLKVSNMLQNYNLGKKQREYWS